ncbi:hypothetical protein WJX84_006532, partial [Apatococcus fuscideae]
MAAQQFCIRYAQGVFRFDYAEDLNLGQVVRTALRHFGLQLPKPSPKIKLCLDFMHKGLELDDNGRGIHPSEGSVLVELMKSGDTNRLQADEAKKDSMELTSIGCAGPRASLFLNRQFKISEYGFGLKAVGVLLCGQKHGCLEVETKTADQRPMTFRRTYGTGQEDRFTRCGGSSQVMETKASYTYVRLQGMDINHLWGSKTASAEPTCLKWAEDITKGLQALYQLYLYSPCDYAKRLCDFIYWQGPEPKGVKWIESLSARHKKAELRAMAKKAITILQQTASYGGPDVRKRLHLEVFARHTEGADGLKQIWETPKKAPPRSSGDSYVEKVLQSAGACCPLGLDIPATSGSQGGYLLLLVVMLKWDCKLKLLDVQANHASLEGYKLAVTGHVPSSPYQLDRKHTSSKIAFSAVISTASVLSAEEYDAAFPQERLASPAVTCLRDQGGKIQRLIRDVVRREQHLPPAWRRLELLMQALGEGHPIQSAICMPLEIKTITPSSVPARLNLVVEAMLHEAQLHKEDGSWILMAPAKQ